MTLIISGYTNKYKKARQLVECCIGKLTYWADYSSYEDGHDDIELYKCKRDRYYFACKLSRDVMEVIFDGIVGK